MVKLNSLNNSINNTYLTALTATGNSVSSLNNGGNFWFTVISYLLFIFIIIGGFIFFRKYLLKKLGNVKSGAHMKITDRLIISQDKQIILIEMKNRTLVVGITQQRMETLAEFEKDDKNNKDDRVEELEDSGNSSNLRENFENNEVNESDENNKNTGFFELLNEKLKTGFDKLNDKNKNEKEKK